MVNQPKGSQTFDAIRRNTQDKKMGIGLSNDQSPIALSARLATLNGSPPP
jgi:hypothetical protein